MGDQIYKMMPIVGDAFECGLTNIMRRNLTLTRYIQAINNAFINKGNIGR